MFLPKTKCFFAPYNLSTRPLYPSKYVNVLPRGLLVTYVVCCAQEYATLQTTAIILVCLATNRSPWTACLSLVTPFHAKLSNPMDSSTEKDFRRLHSSTWLAA